MSSVHVPARGQRHTPVQVAPAFGIKIKESFPLPRWDSRDSSRWSCFVKGSVFTSIESTSSRSIPYHHWPSTMSAPSMEEYLAVDFDPSGLKVRAAERTDLSQYGKCKSTSLTRYRSLSYG